MSADEKTEKIADAVENIDQDVIKGNAREGAIDGILDESGDLVYESLGNAEISPEENKRLLRKIDIHLMFFLCITYGLQFLDKTTLSNASVFGIISDTHLVGDQYSWASSMFYFGYMFFEYPSLFLMQKLPIAKFLGTSIVLWGVVLMCTAVVTNFAGLATIRFILGVLESTVTPGFVAITGIWYSTQEHAIRSTVWMSFNGFASMIGGVLMYGIGHITTGIASWKWIFIIVGALNIVWGLVFLYFVPDNQKSAKFLSHQEKVSAVKRIASNNMGVRTRVVKIDQIKEALLDPKVYLLGLINFFLSVPNGGISAFLSLIITGLGFSNLDATVLTIPGSAIQVLSLLISGQLINRIPGSRLHISTLLILPPIAGTCMIHWLPDDAKWAKLVGVWLIYTFTVGAIVTWSMITSNIAGSTKKTVTSGVVFVLYCLGNIVGTLVFKTEEKPHYTTGIITMLASWIILLFLFQALRALYIYENNKRDKAMGELTGEQKEEFKKEAALEGFKDLTDNQNKYFRYVY